MNKGFSYNDVLKNTGEIIWNVLQKWGTISSDPLWFNYSQLQDETNGTPLYILKNFMRLLLDNDIVVYEALFNDEGKIKGKGYFIKDQYLGLSWKEVERMVINEHR